MQKHIGYYTKCHPSTYQIFKWYCKRTA